jgi:serine/threonine protein kinase
MVGPCDRAMWLKYPAGLGTGQVIRAEAAGMRSIAATPEVDSWSLGCIAYQIFTDKPLFDETYTDEDVRKLLGGDSPLPWEAETETSPFPLIPNLDAGRLVQNLLRSSPALPDILCGDVKPGFMKLLLLAFLDACMGSASDCVAPGVLCALASFGD